jgi:uncharacterized protein YuzE
MQLTYDPRYNVAYIRLREKTAEVETLPIGGELNIDLAPDGTVYGIELLNANPQLSSAERASPANDHRPASPSISLKTNVRW